ncbi:MAG: 3'-5' exonuclease [Spirochaetia bacterium]|jgi:predicted PolB exonuclease-like 3'-5' exonuclease|nr:3'-5' exonuclease [Spirochaetia bacterium]
MNYKETKYLVFDVESVPDSRLIKMVRYPDTDYSGEEAVRTYQAYLMEQSGGSSDFIPATFQYPVSICIAKLGENFTLLDIVSLDEPQFRAAEMTKLFWHGIESLYDHASYITFNGRGFDIPLLELMAYRYGIAAKRHFKDKFAGRYRFGTKHIDLQDVLSNYGAIRMNGGLNLLAKILGKPGKMGTKGNDVYDLFLQGKTQEINDYCIHDVLDTYFVFLRTRVVMREISIEQEADIIKAAREFLADNSERIPALKEYLDHWTEGEPWP